MLLAAPAAVLAQSPGNSQCPCIDPWAHSLNVSTHDPGPAASISCRIQRNSDGACFNATFGSEGCSRYDLTAAPECVYAPFGALPGFCEQQWCYVRGRCSTHLYSQCTSTQDRRLDHRRGRWTRRIATAIPSVRPATSPKVRCSGGRSRTLTPRVASCLHTTSTLLTNSRMSSEAASCALGSPGAIRTASRPRPPAKVSVAPTSRAPTRYFCRASSPAIQLNGKRCVSSVLLPHRATLRGVSHHAASSWTGAHLTGLLGLCWRSQRFLVHCLHL